MIFKWGNPLPFFLFYERRLLPAGRLDGSGPCQVAGRSALSPTQLGHAPHGPWRSRKIKSQPSPSADQLWARYMGIWIMWTTVRIYSAKLQPTSLTMSTLLPLSSFALIGSKQAQSSNLYNTCTDQLVLHMKTGMPVMLCEKKFSLCSSCNRLTCTLQSCGLIYEICSRCNWFDLLRFVLLLVNGTNSWYPSMACVQAHMVQTRNLIQPGYTS